MSCKLEDQIICWKILNILDHEAIFVELREYGEILCPYTVCESVLFSSVQAKLENKRIGDVYSPCAMGLHLVPEALLLAIIRCLSCLHAKSLG